MIYNNIEIWGADNVREIKDFFFRKSTSNTVYIDNFYVNHYARLGGIKWL